MTKRTLREQLPREKKAYLQALKKTIDCSEKKRFMYCLDCPEFDSCQLVQTRDQKLKNYESLALRIDESEPQ